MECPDANRARPGVSDDPGRRHFLEIFLGTSVVASLVSFLYPVLRYLIPPAQTELGGNMVLAGHVGDLKANSGVIFRFGERPALLILSPDGQYHAISAVCTHLGCTVQYRGDLHEVWCACHNGLYTITGKNISGPPPKPLEEYDVFIKGKKIYAQRKTSA
ncbi:MAG TPA: Rieske 2Fe-2S domain-containing protein [Candidatus Acidoferrales bacterium]|nr:Rieske 2Fe-2S domain-containing protein [Candidatus Acidoferrales bacterium]